mmetsp:Transcript_33253/g.103652  ORF Transcript_33253/g.103652 Transcript_33253/m.103652 type:complete len:795 (+) Transcript_33253:2469-4853(+)
MPEEPAELQPLLLAEAKHVLPGDAGRVQLALRGLPDVPEVCLLEEAGEDLVGEVGEQGAVPDGVGHLLAERALEEVGPLREEEDVQRPRPAEPGPAAPLVRAAEEWPQLTEHPEQRGLADAAGAHDQAALPRLQAQAHVAQQEAAAVGRVHVQVPEGEPGGDLGGHKLAAVQTRDPVGAAAADPRRAKEGVDSGGVLLPLPRAARTAARRSGDALSATRAGSVEQEGLHDLVELGHAAGQCAGFGEVHDLAGDLVQGLQARDHRAVGEVEELCPARLVVVLLEGDDAAQQHRNSVLALVEQQLQDLHGELEPRKGDEAAGHGPEVAVQRLLLRGLTTIEADALREGLAARVRRTEGALAGLELRLRAAAAAAEALGEEEGEDEEAGGEAGRTAALARAGPLHVQPDDAAAHQEDACLEEHARVGLHDASGEELKEELHEQVNVVRDPLVGGVHPHVEVAQRVVEVGAPAEVHGLQPRQQLHPPVDHEEHGQVVRRGLHRPEHGPPGQDQGQHPLVGYPHARAAAEGLEVRLHPRPHDALQVHENHRPEGQEDGRQQVQQNDEDEGAGALVADQDEAPEAAEGPQPGLALGGGPVGGHHQGARGRPRLCAPGARRLPRQEAHLLVPILLQERRHRELGAVLPAVHEPLEGGRHGDAARRGAGGRAGDEEGGGAGHGDAPDRELGVVLPGRRGPRVRDHRRGVAPEQLAQAPRGGPRDGAARVVRAEFRVVPALAPDLLRALGGHLRGVAHAVPEAVLLVELKVQDLGVELDDGGPVRHAQEAYLPVAAGLVDEHL